MAILQSIRTLINVGPARCSELTRRSYHQIAPLRSPPFFPSFLPKKTTGAAKMTGTKMMMKLARRKMRCVFLNLVVKWLWIWTSVILVVRHLC